jgi:Carboxypeptidase regulatory-like domain
LPGVSITIDGIGSVVSDQDGQYEIMTTATGNYTVSAHKDGFRDKTRTITIAEPGQEFAAPCNFQVNYGLIPNTPDIWYALDCVNRWLYPPNPDIGLDMWTALAVINAWLYPLQ